MRFSRIFIAFAAIPLALAGARAGQDKVYTIEIRVFEIPPIQTVTSSRTNEDGSVIGFTTGGNVTSGFPDRPILIQTELGPIAADEEMKSILYDKEYLSRSCLPKGASWHLDGSYSLSCPDRELGMDSKRREYDEPAQEPSPANHFSGRDEFHLIVLPVSVESSTATLNLRFAGRFRLGEGLPALDQVLLDQDFKVSLGKTALIGFPKRVATPRTIYILAVCVRQQGS
jgi:hypothetical protein